MKQRKCPKCGHWNQDEHQCTECGYALTARLLHDEYIEKLEKEDSEKAPSKIEIWLNQLKQHDNVLVRMFYYVLFSIWSIYMFIVSVFVFIIATTPG